MENKRNENNANTDANINANDLGAIPITVNINGNVDSKDLTDEGKKLSKVQELKNLINSSASDGTIIDRLKSMVISLTKDDPKEEITKDKSKEEITKDKSKEEIHVEESKNRILIELFATLIDSTLNLRFFEAFILSIPQELRKTIINGVPEKRSLVQKALIRKNIKLVKLLIKHGVDIFTIPPTGNSIMHLAIYDNNILKQMLKIIEKMIRTDNIVIPEVIGKVLYYAIFEKKLEALEILLNSCFKKFININIMNVTPIHIAFAEANSEAVEILINNGADLFLPAQEDQVLPIHVACARGDMKCFDIMINYLLKLTGEKTLKDYLIVKTKNTQMTPLHFASFKGNLQIIIKLLKLVPEILDYQSSTQMTALHYVIS